MIYHVKVAPNDIMKYIKVSSLDFYFFQPVRVDRYGCTLNIPLSTYNRGDVSSEATPNTILPFKWSYFQATFLQLLVDTILPFAIISFSDN